MHFQSDNSNVSDKPHSTKLSAHNMKSISISSSEWIRLVKDELGRHHPDKNSGLVSPQLVKPVSGGSK